MSIPNRTFGIELEMYLPRGKSHSDLAHHMKAAFRAAGLDAEASSENYNHQTRPHWKIVTDGSLGDYRTGAEVVSPILKGEDGLKEARIAADACKSFGCTVKKECGFHVHVGAADMTADQMRKLFLNFVWFEDFFDHIMPPSRRASTNGYVNSNRARVTLSYGTAAVNQWFSLLSPERVAEQPSYLSAEEKIIRAFTGGGRYFKLNPTAYDRQKTMEFRQHSGTVDADKVEQWVRLIVGFVEKSMVSKPRPRTVTRDLKPIEEMNRLFAYLGTFIGEETKRYYMARRKALYAEAVAETREAARILANAEPEARRMIEALNARRERVLAYASPQRRLAARLANAAYDLRNAIEGALPYGISGRAEAIANAIRRTNGQRLLPTSRTAREAA